MSRCLAYGIYGAAFGLLFPLVSWAFIMAVEGWGLALGTIASVHRENPLLWIIDTAPLFLGAFASFAGHRQDRVLQAVRTLEATVADRTAHLEEARDRALAANSAKDRFFELLSHELRTPLNSVIGFSKVLLRGGATKEREQTYLQSIHENGNRLLDSIDQILDLVALQAGDIEMPRKPTSLRDVIADVAKGAPVEAPLILSVDVAAGLPLVLGDPNRIARILRLLVDNACRHAASGVIRVVAGVNAGTNAVGIEIADRGPGIPAEDLERLLQPFEQLQSGLGRPSEGLGIGLPLAQGLCRAMGYELAVESELGEGTTARITIPERLTQSLASAEPPRGAEQDVR